MLEQVAISFHWSITEITVLRFVDLGTTSLKLDDLEIHYT